MKLEQLLSKIRYEVSSGDTDIDITDVIYDSRKVCKNCVFVCLAGANTDGHQYAQAAVDAGAAAVVVSKDIECTGAAVIKVTDTREALAFMSAAYFGYPSDTLKTIAVTGTKGKTTTACMIRSILEKGRKFKTKLLFLPRHIFRFCGTDLAEFWKMCHKW